jgi:hypothetical protein
MGEYRYRQAVLEELLRHGVRPKTTTPPQLVMSFLSDLYRYEIRRLRSRLLAGEIRKSSYAGHIVDLRKRYPLLSLNTRSWTEAS